MGVPAARRAEARGVRGSFLYATLLLVLGLAVFVVALNVRYYSTMCGSDNVRDEALKKAAMERRIKTLEREIMQNGILLNKVLDALESAFGVSSLFSVDELRQLAQAEAADIATKRARQPPPPMSEYARAKVSAAVDGGNLQDLVEAAVSGVDTSTLSELALSGSGNQGWDWGPQTQTSYEDDFLGKKEVESVAPPKFDVTNEEREKLCQEWLAKHNVLPGVNWGTLQEQEQRQWREYRCDDVVNPAAVGGMLSVFGDLQPLEEENGGDGSGGGDEGVDGGAEVGEEKRSPSMPKLPNDDIVHSDTEQESAPRDDRLRGRAR